MWSLTGVIISNSCKTLALAEDSAKAPNKSGPDKARLGSAPTGKTLTSEMPTTEETAQQWSEEAASFQPHLEKAQDLRQWKLI